MRWAVVIGLVSALVGASPVHARTDERFGLVGALDVPWASAKTITSAAPLVVDDRHSRLVSTLGLKGEVGLRLMTHDLNAPVPTPIAVSSGSLLFGSLAGPYLTALDPINERLLALSVPNPDTRPRIERIDLQTLESLPAWELAAVLPGFLPSGMTYSEADQRVYLVGTMDATFLAKSFATALSRPSGPVPTVVALENDGTLAWLRPLDGCHEPLDSFGVGSLIARSSHRPVLYTFCTGGSVFTVPGPGQTGLIRLHITPDADQLAARSFSQEFFPVSGQYRGGNSSVTGVVGFDPQAERVFVQSLAFTTPGGWVFDGLRSAWVGFVAAPDHTAQYLAVNPETGRYYMAADGYFVVTDGRSTPPQQGEVFPGITSFGQPITDRGRRVFVRLPGDESSPWSIGVLEDRTRSISPLGTVDFDALTSDLPIEDSFVTFSTTTSGFGGSFQLVGGYEGASSGTATLTTGGQHFNPANLSFGDRGVVAGHVPSVDSRNAGASASARALAPDNSTDADRGDAQRDAGQGEALDWPYSSLACLDGDGTKQAMSDEDDAGLGEASATCDLAEGTAQAHAEFGNGLRSGPVSVASGSYEGTSFREAAAATSEAAAVAEGISLTDAVAIDRVVATGMTKAGGRPGTTAVRWVRRLEGVHIGDLPAQSCVTVEQAGEDPQDSGGCDALVAAINQALPSRLKVDLPEAHLVASPKGAIAQLTERESVYLNDLTVNNDHRRAVPALQVTAFNDSAEKSRLLVQLAAIDANSIFTLSSKPTFPDFEAPKTSTETGADTGSTGFGESGGGEGTSGTPGSPGRWVEGDPGTAGGSGDLGVRGTDTDLAPSVALGADGLPGASGAVAGQPVIGWLIGARGPRDAALAAGIWLLFAGAVMGAWRRRRLIETVGG